MEKLSGRLLLGSIQLIAAYEFVVSGLDKVVSGRFPSGLAPALMDGMKDNPNQWYMEFIHSVVMPHAAAWGYLIEWGELAVGIGLLLGAARWLLWPQVAPQSRRSLAEALTMLSLFAALMGAFMAFNFHLYMGQSPITLVNPSDPFDEGVDLDLLLTLTLMALATVNAFALPGFARFVETQYARALRLLHQNPRPLRALLAER